MFKEHFHLVIFLLVSAISIGQYQFTGAVSEDFIDGKLYLSLVEDYRKISGVHPEQILSKTVADSLGNFSFSGNNLLAENRIYRIHIDNCTEKEQQTTHFTGHCLNSKEIVFIANNNTRLKLPFSFENEMFCRVLSNNESANALLKLDSLKNDMKFAFGTYRSEANRKLNSPKWFSKLQQFGATMEEPLVELYSFAFFSDRSSSLHTYYLEDIRTSRYYELLLNRLQKKYPESQYTRQYEAELAADKVLASAMSDKENPWWFWAISIIAVVSLAFNFYYFRKRQGRAKFTEHNPLSNQEKKVFALILENKTNKEIASTLFVSLSTVKTHINNIYKKRNVSSRQEAINLHSK